MKIVVQKYGGSSVADTDRIKRVANRIQTTLKKAKRIVVIVSALGHSTDELIKLSRKITRAPSRREMDMLVSTGEQISSSLLTMALHNKGIKAISLSGFQVGITTDSSYTRARIQDIQAQRLNKELKRNSVIIVAGFQGINEQGDITTLGRGGSDLTALAIAKTVKADLCEIYTDVDGIYTADPRTVPSARKIHRISYEEMLELASAGAHIMQARSIEFAGKYDIPIHVRSSFNKSEGTWVVKGDKSMENVLVRGVTVNKKEAKITLTSVRDKPGTAGRLFRNLANAGINVDMIIQNIGHFHQNVTDISFTVPSEDLDEALASLRRIRPRIPQSRVVADKGIAKISVVGIGMRSHSGVAADMFEVLGRHKINIDMISTSEIKISCVVKKNQGDRAARLLHRHFIK
jgi:aspartate kinase